MRIHFTKAHGLGNDFILIDAREFEDKLEWKSLSKRFCNRRTGIGADQLLLLCESKIAEFRMRIFNQDGSEVEMCGNGIRVFANYIWKRGLSESSHLEVETLAGIIRPEKISQGMVRVDMGEYSLSPENIPVKLNGESVIDHPLNVNDKEFLITCVSMGNPHTVIVVKNLMEFPVSIYGPIIETHPLFPRRTNVEFVEPVGDNHFMVRVWERGAGETPACGTGACAVGIAMKIKKIGGEISRITLPGGELHIEIKDKRVFMTGPTEEVFEGYIEI